MILLLYFILFDVISLVNSTAYPTFAPTSKPTYIPGTGTGLHGCQILQHGFYSNVMIKCVDNNAKYSDSDISIPTMTIIAKDLVNYNIVDQLLEDDDNNIFFNISIFAYPKPIPDSIIIQESSSIDYVDKLIGVALDGIPIYTAMLEPGVDALEPVNGESIYRIDYCGGTYGNTPDGVRYHYRTIPACVRVITDNVANKAFNNAAIIKRQKYIKDIHELLDAFDDIDVPIIIGYSLTGYPIYSPFDSNGILQNNLDNCNGKFINGQNYAYYVTPTFPYVIGCNGPGIYDLKKEDDTIQTLPSTVQVVKYDSCPLGSYFDGNTNGCSLCPAGKYATASYSRDAARSSAFDIAGGTCNQVCPAGHFCPKGSIRPLKCGGGRYGASFGLKTKDCDGPCSPGYYCTPGSTNSKQYPCGVANFYCPLGSAVRNLVSLSFYSVPENVSDLHRTSQEPCPSGSFCVNGLEYSCPAGTYSPSTNQISCKYSCPRGFTCPIGSLHPIACAAGRYGSMLGLSNSSCSGQCSPGFYCPAGSISSTQVPCPSGRYGGEYGLQTEQCSPICETVTSELELILNDDRILSPSQNIVTAYGQGFQKTGTWPDKIRIGDSYGLAVDSRSQIVYVADTKNRRVVKIDKNDGNITLYGGNWMMPSGICVDSSSGDVYVTDTWNNTVTRIRADNGPMTRIGTSLSWKKPSGLTFDSANGNLYVADTLNNRIVKVSRNNDDLILYGTKFNNGNFNLPIGLAFDSSTGNLFVGSYKDQRIYLISANDGFVYTWGPAIQSSTFTNDIYPFNTTAEKVSHKRLFGGPQGLTYDSTSGTLYYTYFNTLYSITSNDSVVAVYKSDNFYNMWDVDIDIATKSIYVSTGEGISMITLGQPVPNAIMVSKNIPFCEVRYCSRGYYCPKNSTSPTQFECGGSNYYCPPGSSIPLKVDEGYYTIGNVSQPGLMQVDDDVNVRIAQVQCEKGYWCSNGVRYRCKRGYYGGDIGMKSSYCSGQCYAGFICDEASDSPMQRTCGKDASVYCVEGSYESKPVPLGYFSVGTHGYTLTTRSSIKICEPGFYCVDGIKRSCPAGRYSSINGSSTADCEGLCQRGFYCPINSTSSTQFPLPAGRYGGYGMESQRGQGICISGYYCPPKSYSPTQFECGGEGVYCPAGSGSPSNVTTKHYSTGQNSTIRTSQAYCDINSKYYGTPPAGTKRVNYCPSTMVP